MWITLDQFYKSKEWVNFRKIIISEREPRCWHCGDGFKVSDTIVVHHKIELTLANVNDYNISLNPDNVELVHLECHNEIHDKKHGYNHYKERLKHRGIYIVYGPPLSGKTSYVLSNKQDDDLVVDMDRLYEAVTMLERYNKPNSLLPNVLALRKCLIDNIKVRYGKFGSAWIIGGYPDKYERELLQRELGAELILLKPNKEELYKRLDNCIDYRNHQKTLWKNKIDEWFDRFVE
ncbi:HNH endonuclease signature motif containing protein [Clostridium perfringens]|uniref:HNH endonuclease signature motif containing protein n=1 Tax=Clostridium perfringens TaxID=1502 RepID=UPI00096A2890|nr:HNH endonuclease signature motif containing protein [Clostridium perfringens]